MSFSVGTDTELFLQTEDGTLVSATKYIEGSKHKPTLLPSGGNVTHDNVALEFATPPVVGSKEFIKAVKSTMVEAIQDLPEGIKFFLDASVNFPEKELDNEKCRVFGCDPDYDAWELKINDVPAGAADKPFRSCGGHLHIGYIEGSGNDFLHNPYGKVELIKALDIVAGIPSVILDGSDASTERRKLYGKAGCHRPTDYGVEYRTLSNYWTRSPGLVALIHSMAEDALSLVREYKLDSLSESITEKEIIRVINTGDVKTADKLWASTIKKAVSKKTIKLFNKCKKTDITDIYSSWNIYTI